MIETTLLALVALMIVFLAAGYRLPEDYGLPWDKPENLVIGRRPELHATRLAEDTVAGASLAVVKTPTPPESSVHEGWRLRQGRGART